jgi:hypothetical protein
MAFKREILEDCEVFSLKRLSFFLDAQQIEVCYLLYLQNEAGKYSWKINQS